MSKVKNVSGGPLDVPLLSRTVEADETVDVPDYQPDHSDENPLPIIWPPDKWKPVTQKVSAEKAAKDSDDSGKEA